MVLLGAWKAPPCGLPKGLDGFMVGILDYCAFFCLSNRYLITQTAQTSNIVPVSQVFRLRGQ